MYPGHILFICTSLGEYLSWSHDLSVVNSKHGGRSSLLCVDFDPRRYNPRNDMIRSCDTNCLFLVTGLIKQGQLLRSVIGPQWCDWAVQSHSGRELGKSVCSLYGLPSFHMCGGKTDKRSFFFFFVWSPPRQKDSNYVSRLCCLLWGKEVLVSMMHLGEVKPWFAWPALRK